MFQKSRNACFLETTAPAGVPLTERSFWKLTQTKSIHVNEISKSDIFQKGGFLMVFTSQNQFFTEN